MSTTHLSINQKLHLNNPLGSPNNQFFVGVDVGTGSARATIIDNCGNILALAERAIQRHELKTNYITQSSTEIWDAITFCVTTVIRDSGVPKDQIHGIGFDATCSLVAVDKDTDEPIAVGPDFSDNEQNIILWMDHRAETETEEINATGDVCLKYVGGGMSIEMELPKIKWLKNNMPKELFERCKFYDLPDYLTHRATGKESRSFCSSVCKQGLLPLGVEGSKHGWSKEFLEKVGLEELVQNDYAMLGGAPGLSGDFLSAGEVVGEVSSKAAGELSLTGNCIVGSGIIDAYAGWIGTVASQTDIPIDSLVNSDRTKTGIDRASGRLAAVAGTSTCHLVMSKDPVFVQGVWGPYRDVMAPGYWLAEGGQSCTGALLAHVLSTHPAYTELSHLADASGISKFDYLNTHLERLTASREARSVVALAKHLFFYGDYHGNRSPIADPRMRAAIVGQSMDNSVDDLALMYLGACEFIAQQTRQIVEKMCDAGHEINSIFMSGGQCRNGLLMRLLADCTGLPIVIPRYIDAAVVFGSALLGAVASQKYSKQNSSTETELRRQSSLVGNLQPQASAVNPLASPYTAPSATSSHTNLATSGGFPFPVTTGLSSSNSEGLMMKSSRRAPSAPSSSDDLWDVMYKLTGGSKVVQPSPEDDPDRQLLNVKYSIFLDLAEKQRQYRDSVDKIEAAFSK